MEKVYFNEGDIVVTSTRVATPHVTFATNHVASVRVIAERHGFSREKRRLVTLLGILIFGIGVMINNTSGNGQVAMFIGVVMLIAAYFGTKTLHLLVVGTSGGEIAALQSKNPRELRVIADAISQAIVERS